MTTSKILFIGMDVHKDSIEIAWRAQLRLSQRYKHMQSKGKPHNVTVVALARELAGFMWAIVNEVKYPR